MANQKDFDLVSLRAPKDGPSQGRLLRPAVAVLGHAGAQASRHAHALQHQPARHGRRRHVPRPLRRRARGQDQGDGERQRGREGGEAQSARRRLLLARLRDQGRLSGVHLGVLKKLGWDKDLTEAELATIQQDQSGQSGRGVLGDRPVGRHPARRDEARLHPLRQRQGARECVRPAGCDPGASRADLHAAAGPGREVSDAAERARSSACRTSASTSRRPRWRRGSPSNSRSSSPRAVWSNTKAAAKRPAPTSGSPSCSRTCSSRSIRRTPPSAASRTAAGSG